MPIPSDPPEPFFGWPKKWKDWLFELLDWLLRTQCVPSKVDFEVNEDPNGRRFKLRKSAVQAIVNDTPFRLQIINASENGVGKVRIRLGKIANIVAISSMTDPGDDPPYIKTFGSTVGWKYLYADLTVSYSSTDGIWSATACTISQSTSMPANTATHIYIEIGQVLLSSATGGYAITEIPPQSVTGDQWVARTGSDTVYVDAHGAV